jgi:nucleotide-binding universal stress UspA family protein
VKSFERIIFPTDFSHATVRMAPYAKEMAHRFDAHVTVLHAFDLAPAYAVSPEGGPIPYTPEFQERRKELQQRVEEFAKEHFAGVRHGVRVEDADPITAIERVVEQEASDIVIMPTTGHGRFRRLLLGSVTAKVLHDIACPVLTSAHRLHPVLGTIGYRSILCAVEINSEANEILDAGGFLAQAYRAQLCIVHMESISSLANRGDDATESIKNAFQPRLDDYANAGIKATVRVLDASVPEGIRRTAIEESADLIIAGRGHQRGTFSCMWSCLYAIICESPCPVLSV